MRRPVAFAVAEEVLRASTPSLLGKGPGVRFFCHLAVAIWAMIQRLASRSMSGWMRWEVA